MTREEETAERRSLEAERSTEAAGETSTIAAHELARDLHREAAAWQLRAGHERRAELHQVTAKVHERVATRLAGPSEGR